MQGKKEDGNNTSPYTIMSWKDLYRIAAFSAMAIVILIPIQILVFVISPPPSTVAAFFNLFKNNALLGLLSLDLLLMIDYVLMIPIFLAIYIVLKKKTNQSFAAIGMVIGFIGIIVYFSSNTAFDMLYLSEQYDITKTDFEQSLLLAAGQSMLATFQGTSFHSSYILLSIATLILSILMLKDKVFGKVAGTFGILVAVIGLGLYIPQIGFFLSIVSLIPGTAWYLLVSRSLFRISKQAESLDSAQDLL
ncbi:hypothetical protein [Candidatus Nitrosocosmicus sp. T]